LKRKSRLKVAKLIGESKAVTFDICEIIPIRKFIEAQEEEQQQTSNQAIGRDLDS
jgi:hypothetical protein